MIRKGFIVQVPKTPSDKVLTKTRCPECGATVCYYTDGTTKEHMCTECWKVVTI